MLIASAVITAPRAVNYLDDTIASLQAAGFVPGIVRDNGNGPNATTRAALTELLTRTEADRLVVFQDDIQVAAGLKEWLANQELPETVASLYCAGAYGFSGNGWNTLSLQPTASLPMPWTMVYGALAMVWPRAVAQAFLDTPPPFDGRTKTDQLIGMWLSRNGKPLLIHSPSLVQHTGCVSCFGHNIMNDYRRATEFCDDVRFGVVSGGCQNGC